MCCWSTPCFSSFFSVTRGIQQCQALSHRQRPYSSVEGGRPRSGDGALLCPAQLPGALGSLATNDLIGINSNAIADVSVIAPHLARPITHSAFTALFSGVQIA